jgi:spectinomycin phosphotransferase
MPGKPNLRDQEIIACLEETYGLKIIYLNFLPIGADQHVAVYHAETESGDSYLLKLKRGGFNEISLRLPRYFNEQGISQVTPPLAAKTGALFAALDSFKLVLYPFIQGKDATETPLSDVQWVEFGRILKRIHALHLPSGLMDMIPKEAYTPRWRETVRTILQQIEDQTFNDPVAIQLKTFLLSKRAKILNLIQHTGQLVAAVQTQTAEFVPCHADIHAANLLVDHEGGLHILDWDDLILAPKERDLMYIGAGICGVWDKASEGILFYEGYGTSPDPTLITYYRCNRIIEDIALFSEHILEGGGSLDDRELSLHYLQSNFKPNGSIELALKTTYAQNNLG